MVVFPGESMSGWPWQILGAGNLLDPAFEWILSAAGLGVWCAYFVVVFASDVLRCSAAGCEGFQYLEDGICLCMPFPLLFL